MTVKKIFSTLLFLLIAFPAFAEDRTKETAYDRIMRTGTLRCGYVVIGISVRKDPNTGAFSGVTYDLVEEIGKILDLDIQWTEEVTFATSVAGLKAGRYDAICTQLYARPNIMKDVELTSPYGYVPVNVYGRTGESRFQTKADIDRPEVTVAAQDGTIPDLIRQSDFPRATPFSSPEFNYADMLMSVATKKADLTFVDPSVASDFMAHNPGQIEQINSVSPLRIFPVVLGVNKGEHDLDTTLSSAIDYLIDNGQVETIFRRYETRPGDIVRTATPYRMESPQ